MLPGPAYPHVDEQPSCEVHLVELIPGPGAHWADTVLANGARLTLEGHDTGMMIPHLSPIMDNLLLPILEQQHRIWV
jgi:hypothetical protein